MDFPKDSENIIIKRISRRVTKYLELDHKPTLMQENTIGSMDEVTSQRSISSMDEVTSQHSISPVVNEPVSRITPSEVSNIPILQNSQISEFPQAVSLTAQITEDFKKPEVNQETLPEQESNEDFNMEDHKEVSHILPMPSTIQENKYKDHNLILGMRYSFIFALVIFLLFISIMFKFNLLKGFIPEWIF